MTAFGISPVSTAGTACRSFDAIQANESRRVGNWLLGLALAVNLYLLVLTLARVRLIGAQLAVLTIRVTEIAETVDALDADLRGGVRG